MTQIVVNHPRKRAEFNDRRPKHKSNETEQSEVEPAQPASINWDEKTRVSFEPFILTHESSIRLGVFLSVFALIGLWEMLFPRRSLRVPKAARWANNLALVILNTLLLRLLFPLAGAGMAAFCAANGWGFFNYYHVPYVIGIPLAVIFLDFVIWLQHVIFHAVPVFWRLHRVHHADPDYDVTTGARFHPVEIVLSMLIKFAAIAVLGPPLLAVLIFELLLNATAMFNHGNIRMPATLDRVMRWFIVTPDMHRVHHSVEIDEANSNFGFNVPWWDRTFGTYQDQPRAGHQNMTIGIHGVDEIREVARLPGMLLIPFRGKVTDYAINKRRPSSK